MSFQTHHENGLVWLTSDILSGVRHGFSTRKGGVSAAPWDTLNLGVGRGDDMANVQENYRRFCAAVGTDSGHCVLSKQVHEDNVRLVTANDCGKGLWRDRDYTSVDAMICNTPEIPLVVFSADCNIILLYDPENRAVGAAHAGWRGTALGIVKKTVEQMTLHFGTDPARIRAAIGPSIGACCFETDGDVPEAIGRWLGGETEGLWDRRDNGKFYVDLRAANARRLRQLGLREEHVDVCGECTRCLHDKYWSHRYTRGERGSQAAVIVKEGRA